jgi:4-aminobutyrate aminotransferase-like enzyme
VSSLRPALDGVMVNGFDLRAGAGSLSTADADLLRRRRASLGDLYPLFYDHPIHVVRGSGARLFDADGREYLDAYNNVQAVGHSNPRVAEAVHRQLTTMNTHTRYLQDGVVDFSERFLATFPDHLDHVVYGNSGSESNDLAVRIAQWRTGHQGVIVTRNAYHGTTALLAGLSPENGSRMPLQPFVRLVDPPDAYRDGPEAAQLFAARVQAAMWDLTRYGHGTAALMLDSIMSTDGIFTGPVGLLDPAFRLVRAAGGLVIADEVQPGMGRTGEHLWGFQRHTDQVDLVTCGKPLAGGLPMGALALSAELSDAFAAEHRYFNTFGGNPAAVAAANAVLDEIDERGLIRHAKTIGTELGSRISLLTADDDTVGDVRGAGLFIGVEIVTDRESRTPDGARAHRIVNDLRALGVLISAVGPHGQVLKIRPPLVFDQVDADLFMSAFAAVLGSLGEV